MKRFLFLFILILSLNQISLLAIQNQRWLSPSGARIDVLYRTFQPGEIIIVSIKDTLRVKDAKLHFLGKKYSIVKDKTRSQLLAFIGLDLGLLPGSYIMKIFLQDIDDKWETLEKEISVLPREFPEKKLWVNERYVTPPPGVKERIEREAEILRSVYAIFTPQWLGQEKFIIPTSGEAVENFGERRIYNNKPRSSHGGVDISAPFGNLVKASNSGRIVLAGNLYFSGKTVIIDHGLGLFTLYCHFSKIKVKRGDVVDRGDVIGEVGATGRVTGPHLHWGVKISGSRVDPFSLLSLSF